MHQLTEEIIASKEWRVRELVSLKKIGVIALNEYPAREQQQYYRNKSYFFYNSVHLFAMYMFKNNVN